MNFEQLLDTNTPFDQNKLNLLDQIVMGFYTTANPTDVIYYIKNILNLYFMEFDIIFFSFFYNTHTITYTYTNFYIYFYIKFKSLFNYS